MAEAGHNRFAATRYNVFAKLHVYPGKCIVMLTTPDSTVEYTRERMFAVRYTLHYTVKVI